jgi:hypothetical protein
MAMQHVELRIEPVNEQYDADDDQWFRQVAAFRREFADDVDGVRRETTVVPGTRGAIESVVLAVTSAGTMTAAAEFFKAWLGRSANRRIKVSLGEGGQLQEFELAGTDLDDATMDRITEALMTRLTPSPPP